MDAEPGGPPSRAPRVEDLVLICRALNESGARYVVVGGFAVILHGYARGTMDIDLAVDPSPANIRRVKSGLAVLPDNAAAQVDDSDVERHVVVRVADEVVVDLLGKAAGVPFDELAQGALRAEVEGVAIPYASLAALIRSKDTVRPKDKLDCQFLRLKLRSGEP